MKKKVIILIALCCLFIQAAQSDTLSITDLRTEQLTNPLGLDTPQPRFSWRLQSGQRNVMQTTYRLFVASSPELLSKNRADVWDSGEVRSDASIWISYQGPSLQPNKRYYWKVQVTTGTGESAWSEPAFWGMGLMGETRWKGRWIGMDRPMPWDSETMFSRLSARYVRKEFKLSKAIKEATLHISGLGVYECLINGERVGDLVLAPAPTDYRKTVLYNSYDVTSLLRSQADNAIGITLGNGRYHFMRQNYRTYKIHNFGYPKVRMNLIVEYTDGSRETIATDTNWKLTADGPIRSNNEFDGEEYDARKELGSWSETGYDDSSWLQAERVSIPSGYLRGQTIPGIKVVEKINPRTIRKSANGYILDMGQNMVGWLAVELEGRKDRPVRLRFAETLQDDGNLYVDNLRGAKATDLYTPAEDGTFSWTPRFTYHGFRYVEIAGAAAKPDLEKLKGEVIYDAMPTTGRFETSDSTINQVYRNAYWGLRGNYRSMPTDCPQRDERMGWLGDRAMECIGESFMFRQALLYEKWARDIRDSQLPDGMIPDLSPTYWPFYSENVTYPAAYLCVVDMLYNQYGDEKAVREHYPAMKKWIDYANERLVENDIVVKDVYGDWCMPPESPELIHSQDPARVTDGRLVGTSFFYRLLNMMARFAAVAGHEEDIPAYLEQAARVKDAYNRMFLNPETGQYANNTVSAGLLSLVQGLVPDTLKQKVFDELVRRTEVDFDSHVSTGMIGMQFMMRGLSRYGRPDLALTLATNRTYPSWGYMIDRGATTIWELWNGDTADPAMNSGNHLMQLGDLIAWDWENLAGIQADPAAPGFKHILMKPDFPQGLEWVDASYESMYGTIGSHWKRTGGGLSWSVEIPANTTATLRVPASDVSQVEADGKPLAENPALTDVRASDGFVTFEAGSGSYRFLVGK